jgi:hypothetical protein
MRAVSLADPSGRWVEVLGVRALAGWDCGFESRRVVCVGLVSVECCQVHRSLLRAG